MELIHHIRIYWMQAFFSVCQLVPDSPWLQVQVGPKNFEMVLFMFMFAFPRPDKGDISRAKEEQVGPHLIKISFELLGLEDSSREDVEPGEVDQRREDVGVGGRRKKETTGTDGRLKLLDSVGVWLSSVGNKHKQTEIDWGEVSRRDKWTGQRQNALPVTSTKAWTVCSGY